MGKELKFETPIPVDKEKFFEITVQLNNGDKTIILAEKDYYSTTEISNATGLKPEFVRGGFSKGKCNPKTKFLFERRKEEEKEERLYVKREGVEELIKNFFNPQQEKVAFFFPDGQEIKIAEQNQTTMFNELLAAFECKRGVDLEKIKQFSPDQQIKIIYKLSEKINQNPSLKNWAIKNTGIYDFPYELQKTDSSEKRSIKVQSERGRKASREEKSSIIRIREILKKPA